MALPDAPLAIFQAALASEAYQQLTQVASGKVLPGEWLLLVSRTRLGDVVFLHGQSAGTVVTQCGEHPYTEVLLGLPLSEAFLGGAVFDLDGQLVGVVGRCNGRTVAIHNESISRLIKQADDPTNQILTRYGFRLAPVQPHEGNSSTAGTLKRFMVVELWEGSVGHLAGLEAGDILLAVNGHPVEDLDALRRLTLPTNGTQFRLLVVRNGRPLELTLTASQPRLNRPQETALGFIPRPPTGVEVSRVLPASWADSIGLQPGDVVLAVDGKPIRTATQLGRLLRQADRVHLMIVRRGARRIAIRVSEELWRSFHR